RQRMVEDMQVRNLSVHTQKCYVLQVSLFARHFNKSPELLGPEQIRAYQVYLTNEKKLSTGSILIAISALRFLYKVTLQKAWSLEEIIPAPKKPQKLPVVLSPEEVIQFLDCITSRKHRAILSIDQQKPAQHERPQENLTQTCIARYKSAKLFRPKLQDFASLDHSGED